MCWTCTAFEVDFGYIDEHYELVYQNPDVRIYATGIDEDNE